jgi:hypothetical protein
MNVWRGKDDQHREHQINGSPEQVDVLNYSTDFSLSSGAELMAVVLNGSFQPIVSGSSLKVWKLLKDNFGTIIPDEGEYYNAQDPNDDEKTVLIHGNWYTGWASKNWLIPCFKYNGGWYALGEGLLQVDVTMDDGGKVANATYFEEPVVTGSYFSGLKKGHPVTITWGGQNQNWHITRIQDEYKSGVWGGTITVGTATYTILSSVDRDYLDGAAIYCRFDGGYYRVLEAACS